MMENDVTGISPSRITSLKEFTFTLSLVAANSLRSLSVSPLPSLEAEFTENLHPLLLPHIGLPHPVPLFLLCCLEESLH